MRVSPKLALAVAHLRANPQDVARSSRELAETIGIGSHTLWTEAKKQL